MLNYLIKIVINDLPSVPTETMTTATSPILLKWDPKSLEIRTLTVERLLEPLVTQVIKLALLFKCNHKIAQKTQNSQTTEAKKYTGICCSS